MKLRGDKEFNSSPGLKELKEQRESGRKELFLPTK